MKKLVGLMLFVFIVMSSCSARKQITGNYSYETSCLGSDFDGSQVLRSFGTGKYKIDAIENGKIRALRDVIFNGIRSGKEDCQLRPIIVEVQAQEKYEEYFNIFFKKGGDYTKFVSASEEPILKKIFKGKRTNDLDVAYEVIVKVDIVKLKEYLKQSN
jgi:hypothetical protein